jgi:hypothetical protein
MVCPKRQRARELKHLLRIMSGFTLAVGNLVTEEVNTVAGTLNEIDMLLVELS